MRKGFCREGRDATGERVDERSELVLGERAVDVSPTLGEVSVDVVATEDDLERARPTHEPRKALRASPARNDPHGDLRLGEYGLASSGEAHIHRERKLAAAPSRAALDYRDRHLRHRAKPVHHRLKERKLARGWLRLPGKLEDQVDVGVRDEELRIRAVDHHDSHLRVGLDFTAKAIHVCDQRRIEKVDRRVVNRRKSDTLIDANAKSRITLVLHLGDATRPDNPHASSAVSFVGLPLDGQQEAVGNCQETHRPSRDYTEPACLTLSASGSRCHWRLRWPSSWLQHLSAHRT